MDLNRALREQWEWHWNNQVGPRLDGLTDDEYFWEPVTDGWNVRPRGTSPAPVHAGGGDFTIDFAFPEPSPPPVTTIAWRLGHVIVGVLAMRNASHFGAPAAAYETWDYAGTAAGARRQLDEQLAIWLAGVSQADLEKKAGPSEPYPEATMAELVLHINRELIHHLSEVCLLRDLYPHTNGEKL
ncbi:DinB family protein [Actinoplanes sp. NPDC048988]|uniref:DinB family protein n=1 Tax=Actinoplanes sp. NPDC048988 TaxID=3363901 RepID=UPI00371EEEB9